MGGCASREVAGSDVDMSRSKKKSSFVEVEEDALEHISEREDHEAHEIELLHNVLPSSKNATPLTPRRSVSPRKSRPASIAEEDTPGSLANSKKFNSTSTLFVSSTVSSPDMDHTLECVALALHYICLDGHAKDDPNTYPNTFDERLHPLTEDRVYSDYAKKVPESRTIYEFMKGLFHAAALTAECGIITLVYVNRARVYTGLDLHASNWKRVLLGAILMASKVWDDQAVWNVDYCSILPKIDVEDINDLERTYLEMLQFNINVDSSVYAKYYFELRGLAEKSDTAFPMEPMRKETAIKLEAMSERGDQIRKEHQIKGSKSLDAKTFTAHAVFS